ncbi:MAG: sulfurtransferase [Gammaproteobacteria bacterium RBG_16_51_14]|nr:MAG: sulfurtransferase [Gammaproteobacteria bacterium RBG_16_51_14]
MIKDISAQQAWLMLQTRADAVLLDVRSTMEYYYVGHPAGALHIPLKEPPDWAMEQDFVEKVSSALVNKTGDMGNMLSAPVLIICRSGKRSMEAAAELSRQGFEEIYNIAEGFEGDKDEKNHRNTINGWRFHNLPWEQT